MDEVYRFLLRQNFELEGLSFYVEGQAIVLSLIIYDRYLNLETGMHLLRHLLKKADYYDNVLVEEYGARWANA
jgi:serine protease Do